MARVIVVDWENARMNYWLTTHGPRTSTKQRTVSQPASGWRKVDTPRVIRWMKGTWSSSISPNRAGH